MRNTLLTAVAIIVFGIFVGTAWATLGTGSSGTRILRPGAVMAADAATRIGQTITVEGIVREVHVSERATFIDLNGRYPYEEFTGVIFSSNADAFPNVGALEGKTVDITGTVQMYRGRPEIILASPNQIQSE